MIKLLLLALLFFLGYSFFQALFPSRPKGEKGEKYQSNRSQSGEQMVQDPQCGTYLPLSEALSANIQGHRHYFCSRKCRSQFKKKA